MVLWLDPMRPAFLRDRHAHFDGSIRLPADLSLVDDAEFPGGAVSLVVMSSQVVQSRDRWLLPDRGVGPVVIVGVDPAGQGREAVGF